MFIFLFESQSSNGGSANSRWEVKDFTLVNVLLEAH